MVDPIAIVEKIIQLADFINTIVQEVKAFPDLVKKLDFKIQLMKPSLDFLSNMSSQKGQLIQYCKDDPNLHLFAHSLTQIFECIKEVYDFIDKIKGMSNFDKVRKKDWVNKTYNDLDWKLNELHKSIQFSLLTEVKADVNRGADPVQTLIKHARQSGAFSSSTGSPVDRQPKAKQPYGAERLSVLKMDDFDLTTPLGEGVFGEVWKAEHKNGGKVAVKIFDNASNKRMVLKEACNMQRAINSPNMVRLLGIIDEPDCRAIVMDYFENGSLKSFMKYMNCDCMARRMRMLCDISIGMNYLHSTLNPPIIHKDIKACNIFIDHGLMAKLGDLGLSSSSTTSLDRSVTVGTVSHLPPESWSGKEMKAKKPWDIYEFGITVYEITSGEDPWPSYANPAQIRGWVYTDNKRPDDINSDARKAMDRSTPKEISKLMRECWDKSPDRRPTSQDIQKRLTSAYEKRYNARDLRNADTAIYQQMDQVSMTTDKGLMQSSSSADSGIGNSAGRLQDLRIGYQEHGTASRDSGFATPRTPSTQDKSGVTTGASRQQWCVGPTAATRTASTKAKPGVTTSASRTTYTQDKPGESLGASRQQWNETGGTMGASRTSSTTAKLGVTMGASRKQWHVTKEFGKESSFHFQGRSGLAACSIAVCNNSDIVISDMYIDKVYVFNKDGEYKHTVGSPVGNPDGKLVKPRGVAITRNGKIAIVDQSAVSKISKYIKVYDTNGTYHHRFDILGAAEPSDTKVEPFSITVSSLDGTVLVGDYSRRVVTIYDGSDGRWKQTIKLDIVPLSLATNSRYQIIVSDTVARKVKCIDFNGKVMFVLDNFTVDDKQGTCKPSGLTCNDDDILYVALRQFTEYGLAIDNSGHIHQYSPSGKFVQCIMKGLDWPCGITWHNGHIYVANYKSVVVLGKS